MVNVNWQNSNTYQSLKQYELDTGLTLAERNAIANPYGSHSFGGLLIAQLLPQIIVGAADKFGGSGFGGSGDTGSATDIDDVTAQNSKLGEIKSKYKSNNSPGAIDEYLKDLNKLKEEYPNNKNIKAALAEAEKTKKNGGKRTSQI